VKTRLAIILGVVVLCSCASAGVAKEAQAAPSGEELFRIHCHVCHPKGGNIINPKKTLSKKDREANNVKTPEDIIKNMRKPGPGMNPFPPSTLPDDEARKIADYILKTFK